MEDPARGLECPLMPLVAHGSARPYLCCKPVIHHLYITIEEANG